MVISWFPGKEGTKSHDIAHPVLKTDFEEGTTYSLAMEAYDLYQNPTLGEGTVPRYMGSKVPSTPF